MKCKYFIIPKVMGMGCSTHTLDIGGGTLLTPLSHDTFTLVHSGNTKSSFLKKKVKPDILEDTNLW